MLGDKDDIYRRQIKRQDRGQLCERCGEEMENIQVCHQRCPNCGNELTCSD